MAQPTKTASDIITAFELQVNDVTELSSSEELGILNRVYQRICNSKPWEFLKTAATGTTSTDATGTYITVPTDFGYFIENNQTTDNTDSIENNASPKVIYIVNGTTYTPWQIINYSDRRGYVNRSGFAYYDRPNSKIRFTTTPTSSSYEFDYLKVAPLLITSDTPLFPGQFHDMLAYGMAIENDILQLSEKARSYAPENSSKFKEDLRNMEYWNALQQFN